MRRRFVYMGWLGYGNFGDDLLYETWKMALRDELMFVSPLRGRDYVKNFRSFLSQRIRLVGAEKLLLLGGGTALGFGTWARHLRTAQLMYKVDDSVLAGTGAAASDDRFAVGLQEIDWNAWRKADPTITGVRGPITSQEVERGLSKDVPVVGDPALMYSRLASMQQERSRMEQNRIGICLGSHTSTRFDVPAIAGAVSSAATALGLQPVVFQLSDADKTVATTLCRALGGSDIVKYSGDVREMMDAISSCNMFVSERLHGVVAAVALGIPTVPLSYGSKCDDFWLSVAGEYPPITPTSEKESIAGLIQTTYNTGFEIEMATRRDMMVERLLAVASSLRAWRQGRAPSISLAEV